MTTIVRIDLLLYSFLILLSLYLYLIRNTTRENISSRLFLRIIIALACITIIETAGWIVNGAGIEYINLNYWLNTLSFATNILPTVFWIAYIDYKIFNDYEKLKKRMLLYLIPVYIMTGVMIYNHFFRGFIFSINEFNVYSRGDASFLGSILVYITILVSLIFFLRHSLLIRGRITQIILLFLLLPLAGSAIQLAVYGVSLNWPMLTLAVLLTFITVEKNQMVKDALTDLPTRGQLKQRLRFKIKNNQKFSLVLIDLNDFKSINDNFGHQSGDRVLKIASSILTSDTNPEDMVCRYGGDEFMLLIESEIDDICESIISRIDTSLEEYNKKIEGYSISMSFGWNFISNPAEASIEDVIHDTDEKMYADKKRRKDIS